MSFKTLKSAPFVAMMMCVAATMLSYADLPAGYRQLDYVDTDGSTWVNTLFRPACTNAVEIKASLANTNVIQFLYCSRKETTGSDRRAYFLFVDAEGKAKFGFRNTYTGVEEVTPGIPHVFTSEPDEADLDSVNVGNFFLTGYVDENTPGTKVTGNYFTSEEDAYFCLFGGYAGSLNDDTNVGYPATCRFYYFKVWDTKDRENLLCHIVPVYSDHAHDFGLYDIVNDRFLPFHSTLKPPAGYRQLDYVDTDGSTWVNTQFRPICTNAVEMKASVADPSKTQFLYCSRRSTSGSGRRQYSLLTTGGNARFDYQDKVVSLYTFEDADTSPHVFFSAPSEDPGQESVGEMSKSWTLNAFVDGVSVGGVAGKYFTSDANAYFCLFGSYTATTLDDNTAVGNLAECRFYRLKVWDTKDRRNLLCHIVPVYGEAEAAIGLYDLVAKRFLSARGGAFTSRYVLTEDEDWSYSRMNLFPSAVTVDLNGHNLAVATASAATNEQSAANAAYQDLAYVTAAGAQAVKIPDFRLPGTAKVEMKVHVGKSSQTQGLFMSRAGTSLNTYTCCLFGEESGADEGKLRFDFNNKQKLGSTVLSYETDHELVFDGGAGSAPSWTVDGIAQPENTGTNNFTSGGDLCLFTMSLNGNYYSAHCQLYYFTVTTNGVTLLDLRPARRISDGVIGLHDRVGDVFYESFTSPFPDLDNVASKFTNSTENASELRVGKEYVQGYTVVEHVRSWWTSNIAVSDRSYIDTGYIPAATDCIEVRASLAYTNQYGTLFCSRVDIGVKSFEALYVNGAGGGFRFDFNNVNNVQTRVKTDPEVPFTIALDGNTQKCYKDGEVIYTFTCGNDFTPAANLYIFAMHKNGNEISSLMCGNVYWFKVTGADGTLKLDMVPVVRDSDSVAGLYDKVNRRFYSSMTSRALIAGTKVGDGKLYVDVDGAFTGTEITGNITLVKEGEGAFAGGGLSLASTLRPEAGTVGGVTLADGATLDVSALDAPFNLDDNAISFANSANVTIAVGSREIRSGTKLISWTTAPSNIGTLTFRHGETGRKLLVKDDGVYIAPKGFMMIVR